MTTTTEVSHRRLSGASRMRFSNNPAAELALVVALTVLAYFVAGLTDLHESFSGLAQGFEAWQADELPFVLLLLSFGMTWFALRRWRQARSEISQRRQAQEHAQTLARDIERLTRSLLEVQEDERRKLARELHDHFGQSCNAIRVEASVMRSRAEDAEAIVGGAARIAKEADELYQLVHGLLHELRPTMLDTLGLAAALQQLCEQWEERTHIACLFYPSSDLGAIDEASSIAAYRIVQESLTNVARHAGANQVRVSMDRQFDRLRLRIEDDGRGFDPRRRGDGLGILGMRERACGRRGQIRFGSAADGGTVVDCELTLGAQ